MDYIARGNRVIVVHYAVFKNKKWGTYDMETLLLVSLLYAGAFMITCMAVCLGLAYVIYLMKATRPTTY
jgi:hypothetical protein